MGILALVLLLVFGFVCIGVRSWIHIRQTGSSPFLSGPAGHGAVAVLGFAVPFAAAAVLDATGTIAPLVDRTAVGVGAVLAVAGIAMTMGAQLAMGESWRIGIDDDERTDLVTDGPYRRVRNPIYTAMFAFAAGVTLLVPNLPSLLGFLAVVVVINLVVRRIEEPYLVATHGDAYRTWASRTGRFFPSWG
jgi:protein-S-isoprenylcysteine O-methyltransferase Ste14